MLGVGRVFQGLTGGPWKQELPHSRLPSWPVCLRSPHLCSGLLFSSHTLTWAPNSPDSLHSPFQGAPYSQWHFFYGSALLDPLEVQHQSYSHCPLQELLTPHLPPVCRKREKKNCRKREKKKKTALHRLLGACQDPPVREECLETSGASRRPRMPG